MTALTVVSIVVSIVCSVLTTTAIIYSTFVRPLRRQMGRLQGDHLALWALIKEKP